MGVVLGAAFSKRLRQKSEPIKTILNEKSIPRGALVWLEKMQGRQILRDYAAAMRRMRSSCSDVDSAPMVKASRRSRESA